MTVITATDRAGHAASFTAQDGLSLMENLRDVAGLDIAAICGGSCSCATCHIYIEGEGLARLAKQSPDEYELLEFLDSYRPNSRLACQIPVTADLDGLAVTLAPEA